MSTGYNEIDELLSEDQPRRQPESGGFNLGTVVLIIGLLSVIAVVGWTTIQQNNRLEPGDSAPNFTLTTFDGDQVSLDDLRGNIVIINFWGSWCAPCRDEAPALQEIHETYRDRGVVMLGITYAESSQQDSLDFMEEFGLTYMNAADPGTKVADQYGITGVPETFIIDREGRLAPGGYFPGPVTLISLGDVLDQLLDSEAA
jgi:cytochrome c biogenesis protein CcmG, thiol:disulfide interchange protein DsbE